ncbi:MAG: ABC transporter substrate-binding protein [Gammaproteobacteria bacterium]|nr:MAG: ABC transporter substrate-binding protein [Gammaproteobacteria bacterium]
MGGLSAGTAMASECGSVTIADMNWNSATLIANVDKIILNEGYGCDAELVPGDTQPTGASMMGKGEPDIAPEFWSNSMKEALERGYKEGTLVKAGKTLIDGGEEGFWVPKYLVEQYPEMKTISGVKQHAKLFKHPEDPDKGAFYGCPAGWNCQISSTNLFKAMKLGEAGFDYVDPGSGAALAGAIAKAYERKAPWFGYYWAPTAVLGKYEMVKVDFESGVDVEHFQNCITQEDCLNPKPTMYPPSAVDTIVVAGFAKRAPEVMAYLGKRGFDNATMNKLLAWMEENQADGEIAAMHFLETYPDMWKAWVPAEVARKVEDAL